MSNDRKVQHSRGKLIFVGAHEISLTQECLYTKFLFEHQNVLGHSAFAGAATSSLLPCDSYPAVHYIQDSAVKVARCVIPVPRGWMRSLYRVVSRRKLFDFIVVCGCFCEALRYVVLMRRVVVGIDGFMERCGGNWKRRVSARLEHVTFVFNCGWCLVQTLHDVQ